MPIDHWSQGNAFNDMEMPDGEAVASEAFDTHYGTSVMAFGSVPGPVFLQASMDGEHWYTITRCEPDDDGHFGCTQGDWVARYARLYIPQVETRGDRRPRVTATLLGKVTP
jgi:hypothetical protein